MEEKSRRVRKTRKEPLTNKEKEQFIKLYMETYRSLYKYAYRKLNSKEDAEDVLSEAYLAVANKYDILSNAPINKMKYFLIAVIRNKVYDIIGGRQKVENVEDELFEITDWKLSFVKSVEIADIVSKLPEADRDILYLIDGWDISPREVAKLLDIKEDTARQRLHRARMRLKSIIDEGE